MKRAFFTVLMVVSCALLTAMGEAARTTLTASLAGEMPSNEIMPSFINFTILGGISASIPWSIFGTLPILFFVHVALKYPEKFTRPITFGLIGLGLALVLSFPLSLAMTGSLIAAEDDGTVSDATRWAFDAPELVGSSILAWLGFWLLTRKRRVASD